MYSNYKLECIICSGKELKLEYNHFRTGEENIIWRCKKCRHVFYTPDNNFNIQEFYCKGNQTKEWTPNDLEPAILKSYFDDKRRFEKLKKFFSNDMTVLEIGCGFGHFLSMLKTKVKKVVGVEANKERVKYAKEKYNLEIFDKMFSNKEFVQNEFDIILTFFSLEHMEKPKEFLNQIKRILKNNGKFITEVPNHDDILNTFLKLPNYRKFYYQKAHISNFTFKSLKFLMEKFFRNVEIFNIQRYNILNFYHWLRYGKPQVENPLDGLKEIKGWVKYLDRFYDYLLERFKRADTLVSIGENIK